MVRTRTVAWTLGGAAAASCVAGGIVCIGLGAPRTFLLTYAIGVLLALLGALVVSRAPRNRIGWLMIVYGAVASLIQLVSAYGYAALGVYHGAWPLGSTAAWLGAWIWTPTLGFLAVIAVRFPDGRAHRLGKVVDWAYVAGTALFAAPIALAPPANALEFTAMPGSLLAKMLPYFQDPVTAHPSGVVLATVQGIGTTLIVISMAVAGVSLALRYRNARGDEQLQIRWFAYAVALCALATVYGAAAWALFGQQLYLAFTPLEIVGVSVPIAIGIAILRYRLYDIDLIINRTLVYGGLTAILGALYASAITLLNRLFISVSGQKSDAAYVVTAFVVVVAASPIKEWLQHQVDQRVRHTSPTALLEGFRANVDAVISVIDVNRVAQRLLDEAIDAFDARGAALYLHASDRQPAYSRGNINGDAKVEVLLRYEERDFGRLVLGSRRGDVEYTPDDRAVLQQSADSVGRALALAAHLGFAPLATAR